MRYKPDPIVCEQCEGIVQFIDLRSEQLLDDARLRMIMTIRTTNEQQRKKLEEERRCKIRDMPTSSQPVEKPDLYRSVDNSDKSDGSGVVNHLNRLNLDHGDEVPVSTVSCDNDDGDSIDIVSENADELDEFEIILPVTESLV
jgi:hypothetical protein